jgi:hypothetical protein
LRYIKTIQLCRTINTFFARYAERGRQLATDANAKRPPNNAIRINPDNITQFRIAYHRTDILPAPVVFHKELQS